MVKLSCQKQVTSISFYQKSPLYWRCDYFQKNNLELYSDGGVNGSQQNKNQKLLRKSQKLENAIVS